jgi:hypothetical protein
VWLQDRCLVGIEYDEASPKKPREARRATEAAAYIPQIRTAELYNRQLRASPLVEAPFYRANQRVRRRLSQSVDRCQTLSIEEHST